MSELANCSRCNAVFVKTIRDICKECYMKEEKDFQTVNQFLKPRENREATMLEIVDATKVDESLIIKFIKERRLRTSQFPKLAYPCERCGNNITQGRLCRNCSQAFLSGVEQHEKIERHTNQMKEQKRKKSNVYYTFDN